MEDVVDSIYKNYNEKIVSELSEDKFYKYYYNLLETGTTYCKFYNRKIIKEIENEWVDAIEEAIPHIEEVVEKPRRFIEEDRQIVNVAVARKFTVESVKHLSQHSEMIDKVKDDGSIEPNKVLNVFKEESMNTYENRFIYTLILDLKNFVNRRVEVIFDKSRNEDGVKLELESSIDNYNENISYKLEMRIKEKQTDMSNDENNTNIFSRISRIHRKINNLACSGFAVEMQKFPLVKFPVVKTNAISKNQHYKICYALWNFMNSYDRIGYKVELIEQDTTITSQFEKDLYNALLTDYVVLREHMSIKDIMNIDKQKRKKDIGVNVIKQFIREIVNEYDMSESDLRMLVLKELTAAQKEKEAAIKRAEEFKKKIEGQEKIGEENSLESWGSFKEIPKEVLEQQAMKNKNRNKLSKKEKAKQRKEKEIEKKIKQKEEEDKLRLEKQKEDQEKLEILKHLSELETTEKVDSIEEKSEETQKLGLIKSLFSKKKKDNIAENENSKKDKKPDKAAKAVKNTGAEKAAKKVKDTNKAKDTRKAKK